jgi:glycosyltransferase involved in cell wall biosynthesis
VTVAVVVPCYDEAARFDVEAFVALATRVDSVLLVDDGSSDGTAAMLHAVADGSGGRAQVIRLTRNGGKAEAVRTGMLAALDSGADVVAYFDADLATPVDELVRLVEVLRADPSRSVVLASRVGLLGHAIERRLSRHYLGRLYATAASLTLGVPVYDTQCGAKVFRASPALRLAVASPFPDPWSFDVELLARLLHPGVGAERVPADSVLEVPLRVWRDVAGSKVRPIASIRAVAALAGVRRRISERSAERGG